LSGSLLAVVHGNDERELSSFGFAIQAGSPGDFDQILIVGGAADLVLCGPQGAWCGLHVYLLSSVVGDRLDRLRGLD
jgi:hypothetical protein